MFEIIGIFKNLAKENQVIAGAVSLWGLAVISYIGRNYPKIILEFIVKHTTVVVSLTSAHDVYGTLVKWLDEKKFSEKSRALKLSSSYEARTKTKEKDLFVTTIGYGTHFFLYKFRPIIITLTKDENSRSYLERDAIKLRIFGRSRKYVDSFLSELYEIDNDATINSIKIYRWMEGLWRIQKTPKRSLDTIFVKDSIKKEIVEHIDNFKKKEDWYIKNGINYQTGILLYGPPGTGKTSFIKAIASYFGMKVYNLQSSLLSHIGSASYEMEEKSILVIEDIDTNSLTINRDNKSKKSTIEEKPSKPISNSIEMIFTNLSDILNSLDGLLTKHGRIVIATTNHVERLDHALIRDGRFNLKIELGYATNEILDKFFVNFYGMHIPKDFKIKDNVSTATIQALILKNLNSSYNVLKELEHEDSIFKIGELKN